jgi:hypothetical protein
MTRPPAPRQVYSITAQKALASHVGEGNLGPCRLPLTSTPAELVPKLLADIAPFLEPMAPAAPAAQLTAKGVAGRSRL